MMINLEDACEKKTSCNFNTARRLIPLIHGQIVCHVLYYGPGTRPCLLEVRIQSCVLTPTGLSKDERVIQKSDIAQHKNSARWTTVIRMRLLICVWIRHVLNSGQTWHYFVVNVCIYDELWSQKDYLPLHPDKDQPYMNLSHDMESSTKSARSKNHAFIF